MKMQTIKAETRNDTGKGPARRKRVIGNIPAVVYGDDTGSTAITINAKAFDAIVHGGNGEHAVVRLEVEGKPELSGPSVIKAVQHHPIREHVMHADFLRIDLDKLIITQVPINLVGHCVGLVAGGVPDQQLREIELECLPLETPESFEIDITDIEIGGRIHVSDLTAMAGTRIVTDGERTILAIHAPRVSGKGSATTEGEEEEAEEA